MAVTVRKLYESVRDMEIELLAGSAGLDRSVRWVHMVESKEISTFLEGGEIAFTTGVGMSDMSELLDMVKSVAANGGSGIVINIGPYISQVDFDIIEFCEDRQIPLFSVPWNVHMAEIMRSFCLTITLSEKRHLEIESAVKNAVLFPEQKSLYVPHLENHGYKVNECYTVVLFRVDGGSAGEVCRKILLHQIEDYISRREWACAVMEMNGYILLLFAGADYDEQRLEKYIREIRESCTQLRNRETEIGVGQMTKNIYCIAKSFRQAKSVLDLSQMHIRETIFYSRLGIYKLLLNIEDRELIKSYVEETIGAILRYDELNENNLMEVLRIYLKYNGSVKDTAEELFVHRNTVNYKIHRIGELLGKSLTDYEVCVQLNIALKLHDIMGTEVGHI